MCVFVAIRTFSKICIHLDICIATYIAIIRCTVYVVTYIDHASTYVCMM